jgi:hypothetical protein
MPFQAPNGPRHVRTVDKKATQCSAFQACTVRKRRTSVQCVKRGRSTLECPQTADLEHSNVRGASIRSGDRFTPHTESKPETLGTSDLVRRKRPGSLYIALQARRTVRSTAVYRERLGSSPQACTAHAAPLPVRSAARKAVRLAYCAESRKGTEGVTSGQCSQSVA